MRNSRLHQSQCNLSPRERHLPIRLQLTSIRQSLSIYNHPQSLLKRRVSLPQSLHPRGESKSETMYHPPSRSLNLDQFINNPSSLNQSTSLRLLQHLTTCLLSLSLSDSNSHSIGSQSRSLSTDNHRQNHSKSLSPSIDNHSTDSQRPHLTHQSRLSLQVQM